MKKVTANEVVQWTKKFLVIADSELSLEEIKEQKKYASLIQSPYNKTLLSMMLDESSQIKDDRKLSNRLKYLIDTYGIPTFFSPIEKLQLKLFNALGYHFSSIAIPIFKRKLRSDTHKIIIPEERPALTKHLADRWEAKIGQNVNLLGEVVLGDREANHRYNHYMEALKEKDINYISVKLSGIYAQIQPLNYEDSKKKLCNLVGNIFRQATKYPYTTYEGDKRAKFVNLDMEEYKDAELTYDVFMTVLSQPEFLNYSAGIVVQAYLPDSLLFYRRLLQFAKERCAKGGVPLKIRLVKGANLQMETIISESKGWNNPVLPSKVKVDSNYLRILDEALLEENAKCLNVGVATHNFFSIAYAYILSERNKVTDHITFEMLEGMANHLPRVMRKMKKQIILYTPVVKEEFFLNAVSYLVRRLDENTGSDNFLSYSFELQVDSQAWDFLEHQFRQAYEYKNEIETEAYRTQNRFDAVEFVNLDCFTNEPDTNLDLPHNRRWALQVLDKWKDVRSSIFKIPVQIGSDFHYTENLYTYRDKSRNNAYDMCVASLNTQEEVEKIVANISADSSSWSKTTLSQRKEILFKVAHNLAGKRGDLIGCMAAITGKTFMEGDVEVSETIDFCRFYPISLQNIEKLQHIKLAPKGVVLVITPWNFPLAIPVGGVASALAGGNRVLLKPATDALPIAWEFVQCFWEAGVPKDALQLVCPLERKSLRYLTSHKDIAHIIFTGGTNTALDILESAPVTGLSAETGGKNCIIVTASADQDHAIQNIVSSAFGNAGQKCSACSLVLLDKGTYEDPIFKEKLIDAVESLAVGSVWDPNTIIGPMITNSNKKLVEALTNLEEGESWLVAPEFIDTEKFMLRPCVKWGVKPGSFTFSTELFAPLLGVVCIDSLEEGIQIANSLQYGLTAGLQSLDEREISLWKATIKAGNLYVNRGITGAIVNRQPFGGIKRSALGSGAKAGGPNYASSFVKVREDGDILDTQWQSPFAAYVNEDKDKKRINYGYDSIQECWQKIFSKEIDSNNILGEQNTLRYLPVHNMCIRVQPYDKLIDVLLILQAVSFIDLEVELSIDPQYIHLSLLQDVLKAEKITFTLYVELEQEFCERITNYVRIRTCGDNLSMDTYRKAANSGLYIANNPPCIEGRLELLHYLQEQSFSYEYHRYGSIFNPDISKYKK